ncbi:hypothetical protein G7047_09865 [Diaphorobacter sp. HDW4A]|uniref:aspartate/glutamate racemase family protein n=1 Tax=Diaphorobacter sp. HDW4A TaxID=2714924 RepID=UPI0014074CA8|nr:aspartate/glutamate racemase family protein [Diaphorobacter sp. HDW4A]QIL80176.1 hypothetical protein G7047_09865 [Diaphorobacter sp. HDW4A]
MRIWHQSCTELDGLGVYRRTLDAHARAIVATDCSVELHGIPAGRYRGRSPSSALGNAVRAEREGYDAFVLGSFSEPFLRELRSAVDIPVVSLTEASLLVACSLGRYIAPISNAPTTAWMTQMSVESHGLNARVLHAESIKPPLEEPALARGFDDPVHVIASFTQAAREAIADGADVLIPAEGVMAELLWANGVHSIDDCPVVDVFGAAWAWAEMMVKLRKRSGLAVGRAWHYRRADPALIHELTSEPQA